MKTTGWGRCLPVGVLVLTSLVLALVLAGLRPETARAASITVTTTADTIDAAANCASVTLASLPGPGGQISLREAVCAANANAGPDTITFSVNGTFTLTGAANEDNGGTGDLDIKESLTITGNGTANTILDGGGIERIFDVFPSAASTFDLSNLTIQNGDTRTTSFQEGGAMYLHNNVTSTFNTIQVVNNFSGANGAIENRGTLTIGNSVISNNQTLPASGTVVGGGIRNAGTLSINNSTISNNTVRGEGGGIATTTGAGVVVSITNSTISGNTASITGGGLGNGGGISTTGNEGTLNITNVTISGNRADNNGGGAHFVTPSTGNVTLNGVTITNNTADNDNNGSGAGGGFAQNTATVTLRNTIVAGNFNSTAATRDDISGAVVGSSSYTLVGDGTGSSGITNGVNNNQVGSGASPIDPLLGALANNTGPTLTHALLTGSPAINTGNNATCAATDQRGIARPVGGVCDKGAFELADITPPDTTITSTPPNPNSSSTATFTFTGSDSGGSGLAGFQCRIDGGSFTPCTSPQTYLGLADSSHTFEVRAVDGLGNLDPTPASYTWTISDTPDTTITGNPAATTSSTSATFTFTGSGGTAPYTYECQLDGGGFSSCGNPKNYTGLAVGSHTFEVRAIDAIPLTDPTPATYTWTITRPSTTVTSINRADSNPTNANSVAWTVIFADELSGLTTSNFTLNNITVGGTPLVTGVTPVGSAPTTTWTVTASTGTGDGTLRLRLVNDTNLSHSVSNAPMNGQTYDIDRTAPTVDIVDVTPDPRTGSVSSIAITFNENVNGFNRADLTLTRDGNPVGLGSATIGGTNPNFTLDGLSGLTSTPGTYVLTLTASGSGIVDRAGNALAANESDTWVVDLTPPTVEMMSAAANPTNVSPIPVTVQFSESVTGFTAADITTGNGTVNNFAGSGSTYTFDLVPSGQGLVTADIAAGVAQDLAGNNNTVATQFSRTYDSVAPTVTVNQADGQADPTNASPILFTVVFNETVTGFDAASDVTLSGTAGATTVVITPVSATIYTVAVSGLTGPGTVVATIPAGAAQDLATNPSAASTSTDNTVEYDATPPGVTIDQAGGQADPANAAPILFTVVFDEPVTDFGAAADVTLSGTAGATTAVITPVNATTYTVAVSGMTGQGTVIVTVPAGAARDAAGNTSAASTSTDNTVTYDTVAPSVVIDQAGGQADPTNASPILFTVVFNEPVTGFSDVGDVALSGTAGATTVVITPVSATTYTVAVSGMVGQGTVIATIPVGAAQDLATNPNADSTSSDNTVTYDTVAPKTTVAPAVGQESPTSDVTIHFTVQFDEAVTGFGDAPGDVTLGGTAGATTALISGSGTTYDVAVTGMTTNGTVTVAVPAGAARDAATNGNTASEVASVQYVLGTQIDQVSGSTTYGDTTATLTARLRAQGTGAPLSGRTLVFTVAGQQVCGGTTGRPCPTTGANGVATLTGVPVATRNAGGYANLVCTSFLGEGGYQASGPTCGPLVVARRLLWVKPQDRTVGLRQPNPPGTPPVGCVQQQTATTACWLELANGSAFVNGDDWADLNLANLRFAYSRSGPGPANERVGATYRITALGALSQNYDIRYQTGTLTVVAP